MKVHTFVYIILTYEHQFIKHQMQHHNMQEVQVAQCYQLVNNLPM